MRVACEGPVGLPMLTEKLKIPGAGREEIRNRKGSSSEKAILVCENRDENYRVRLDGLQ